MIKLKGFQGFAAYQAYISAIHFLKYCDTYIALGRERSAPLSKGECVEHFKELPENERIGVLFELLSIAELDEKDILALIGVHTDSNGVPITKHKAANLDAAEIAKMAFQTIIACSELPDSLFFYQPMKLSA